MLKRKKEIPGIVDQREFIQTAWAFPNPSVKDIVWLSRLVKTKAESIRAKRANSIQEVESCLIELSKATEAIEFLESLEEVISSGGKIYGKK